MEIIDNRNNSTIPFREVEEGEIFIDGSGSICMKIPHIVTYKTEEEYNAIYMGDGSLESFWLDTKVIIPKAQLIIE